MIDCKAIFTSFNPWLEQSEKVNHDFDSSEAIKALSYGEIIDYFGSLESALRHYKQLLLHGYPRSAAFLMQLMLKEGAKSLDRDSLQKIMSENLAGLAESEAATPVEVLASKIANPSIKTRVLFSSAHWLTGGMERVMSTLFKVLKDDYEIFLITPYENTKSYIDIPDYVTNIKIDTELFKFHFDSIILSYALSLDISVVVGLMNMFEKQLNLYNICVGTKIKTIASNHEYYFYPYKSREHYEVVEKRIDAFKNCGAVIWPNNFNAALCGLYVNNSFVIGNPNNFEISTEQNTTSEKTVLCVGRFNDYVKRIDRIIESFSLILKKVPDAKLVLVGKYDMDALIGNQKDRVTINNLMHKYSIPISSIKFIGEVSNLRDYYKLAKVLMLASNSEGFGMVLNEAACFGVPSVVNYIPGVEDIIVDGENGYITQQGDTESMAERVSDILQSDKLQKKLGKQAQKNVANFDAEGIGEKWKLLIDCLVKTADKNTALAILNEKIGHKEVDDKIVKILSQELNEIFFMAIKNKDHKVLTGKRLLISKAIKLPGRVKKNVEFEGIHNTSKKVVARSYRIVARRVPKRK